MIKHKFLRRGPCPICGKTIIKMIGVSGVKTEFYREFFVRYTDGNTANYALCKDCLETLTEEQVKEIIEDQIFTYGQEIIRQMLWYNNEAVFYKLAKFAKTKEEL